MTELEAVNMILRRLGEDAVTSIDVPYPTVSIARPALAEARKALLLEEWFFNKFEWQYLQPALGKLQVPDGVLAVYPKEPQRFTWTGKYIRDAVTGGHVDTPVQVCIVQDIPFDELPHAAQLAITLKAAYDVYVQDFGLDDSASTIQQDAMQAYRLLGAEHTRHRKYTTRTKRQWARMLQGLHY